MKQAGTFLLLILMLPFILISGVHAQSNSGVVHVIPVSGSVEPGMAAFIKRAVETSRDSKADLIIFEIDTFGGRVDSALEIVDTILTVEKEKSIAYVKTKAISAGALISLASGRLIMKNGTTIGDCAPISYSKDGVEMMGEKFQSPLRARFRALAKRNGFPEVLAEAMVSDNIKVYKIIEDGKTRFIDSTEYEDLTDTDKEALSSKQTVVDEGELLTMDNTEAVTLQFSEFSVTSFQELKDKLNIENHQIIRIQESWSEVLARYLIAINPILMMIGLGALYLEFKSPGFGIAGLIGITCLGLAFGSQYITGLAGYTELLLIFSGMLFLAVEVFVLPGFGISGIAGLILILSGLILSLQGFTIPNPEFPWEMDLFITNITTVLGTAVGGFFLSMFTMRYVFPYIPGNSQGPFLKSTLLDSHVKSEETMRVKVGDRGKSISFLRPSGKALINNERTDVITEGEFIEKGKTIEVITVKDNRIFVAEVED